MLHAHKLKLKCKFCDNTEDQCSCHRCDYTTPSPNTRIANWRQMYAEQKIRGAEGRYARTNRLIHDMLGPRSCVITDTTTKGQEKSYKSQFPHFLVHTPFEKCTRPRKVEKWVNYVDPNHIDLPRSHITPTRITKSTLVPASQQRSRAYDKMVNEKCESYDHDPNQRVIWPPYEAHKAERSKCFCCEDKPLNWTVGEWPNDILEPRPVVVWSLCPRDESDSICYEEPTSGRPEPPREHPDDTLGSYDSVITSRKSDRRVPQRKVDNSPAIHRDTKFWDPANQDKNMEAIVDQMIQSMKTDRPH